MKTISIKDLSIAECIYLAEDLISVLDCRARNDNEFDTSDEIVKENLKKAPILLDMIGWHKEAETLKKITLDNISEFKDFLYDLEFMCLPNVGDYPNQIRYDLFADDIKIEY